MAKPTAYDALIVAAIKTAFETLKTASAEYNVTAKSVFDSNPAPIAEGEQPVYNISEADEDLLQQDSSLTYDDNNLQIYVDILATTAAQCRQMKADAKKLIKANLQWGYSWILTTRYITTQRNVIDQLGNLIANRRIIIEVQYRQTAWSD